MTIDVELDADHRANAGAFCFQAEPNDAANVRVIRYTNRVIAQLGGFSNESFGGDGAVAEGETSVGSKLDGHASYASTEQIPKAIRRQEITYDYIL